jgi:hypothetical protein
MKMKKRQKEEKNEKIHEKQEHKGDIRECGNKDFDQKGGQNGAKKGNERAMSPQIRLVHLAGKIKITYICH